MKKHALLGILGGLVVIAMATSAYAWWVISYTPVTSCNETDTGLDFTTFGHINISGNISGTFYDYCIDNVTVGEMVCSQNMGYPAGYAALIGENCLNVTNTTQCVAGRCV